jgi:hypothetical protein
LHLALKLLPGVALYGTSCIIGPSLNLLELPGRDIFFSHDESPISYVSALGVATPIPIRKTPVVSSMGSLDTPKGGKLAVPIQTHQHNRRSDGSGYPRIPSRSSPTSLPSR